MKDLLETYISFETAKLAVEKYVIEGKLTKFRETYYNHKGELNGDVKDYLFMLVHKEDATGLEPIPAPTQAILQKLLREKYNIILTIIPYRSDSANINSLMYYYSLIEDDCTSDILCNADSLRVSEENYDTYEQALEEGLKEALKLIR